jgi:hypothetical protein
LRTFGWVCARQAAFEVLAPFYTVRGQKLLQVQLTRLPLAAVKRLAQLAEGREGARVVVR